MMKVFHKNVDHYYYEDVNLIFQYYYYDDDDDDGDELIYEYLKNIMDFYLDIVIDVYKFYLNYLHLNY